MGISFEGQVAVVTGAGRGLGRSHALELARRGARVVINDTGGDVNGRGSDASVAEAVCEEIRAIGGTAIPVVENVAEYEGGYNVIKAAMDAFGRVDAVICNAGILRDMAFHNVGEADWDAVINTHLRGTYTVMRAVWPVFRQQAYGRVVLTTSISGVYGNFGQSNYGAAKTGMLGLMNVLKLEGEKYNVMVNVISPGAATRMIGTIDRPPSAALPINMQQAPEEVTPAVVYMASSDCRDSGMIIHAQNGDFYRIAIVRGPGIPAASNADVHDVEWVANNWERITSLENPTMMWNLTQTVEEHAVARAVVA